MFNLDCYWSHLNKCLNKHIDGVLAKSRLYVCWFFLDLAILFHDLGKLNPNFQNKLRGLLAEGYSHHSSLSVLAFYCYLKANKDWVYTSLGEDDNERKIRLLQIITLIAYHHGDIPDWERLINLDEIESAVNCEKKASMPFSLYLGEKLGQKHQPFQIEFNRKEFISICRYIPHLHKKSWQVNALKYFQDTQFAFATLIHADKRDAGKNEYFCIKNTIEGAKYQLSRALEDKFKQFDKSPHISNLNGCRTLIRKEAIQRTKTDLKRGERIFSLVAPTGAGKTYILLSIAQEIQQQKGNLGIIYALPFLSITEQVQRILENDLNLDFLAVSSKASNKRLASLLTDYENNPNDENLKCVLQEDFAGHTFDHPLVVTTFVQLFETLISNKNATLLKLPNFSNRIFLIDEMQALPPRLYIFFAAWLEAFCREHNSYAVFSTATMPRLTFPDKNVDEERKPELLFKGYHPPRELIEAHKYFGESVFNRYKICRIGHDNLLLSDLKEHILKQQQSCLVILNTISDTKRLYNALNSECNVILLNTHFTPADRTAKIEKAKELLKKEERVILISTQLIEAGVDIDFPVVYRDLCLLPNLIQSAGRCNRNKTIEWGIVYLFHLKQENGKSSAKIIYREALEFLDFCNEYVVDGLEEKRLFEVQTQFFDFIKNNLSIGDFEVYRGEKLNMIECVNKAEFEQLGKFQLINKTEFGEEYCYYIPGCKSDTSYDKLVGIMNETFVAQNYEEKKIHKIKLNECLKCMGERMITVRLRMGQEPPGYSNKEEYFGIRVLSNMNAYSPETGLELGIENLFL